MRESIEKQALESSKEVEQNWQAQGLSQITEVTNGTDEVRRQTRPWPTKQKTNTDTQNNTENQS